MENFLDFCTCLVVDGHETGAACARQKYDVSKDGLERFFGKIGFAPTFDELDDFASVDLEDFVGIFG